MPEDQKPLAPLPTAPMGDPLSTLRQFVASRFSPDHKVFQWGHQDVPAVPGQELQPWQKTAATWGNNAIQGGLGVAGLGDCTNTANRFGQVLGAAMPLVPGLGKFRALGELGSEGSEAYRTSQFAQNNPIARQIVGDRMGSAMTAAPIVAPTGLSKEEIFNRATRTGRYAPGNEPVQLPGINPPIAAVGPTGPKGAGPVTPESIAAAKAAADAERAAAAKANWGAATGPSESAIDYQKALKESKAQAARKKMKIVPKKK